MWPYWLFFLIPAFLSMVQKPSLHPAPKKWPVIWWIGYFVLVMIVGLRYEVGGDWYNYAMHFDPVYQDFSLSAFLKNDPAYKILIWIAIKTEGGMVLANFLASVIFSWGLVVFCRAQPRSWLALAVAIPYLVIVVAMGYTRQGISIGLVMLAFIALFERKMTRYFVFMAVAVMFHKSAIIMLPLVALTSVGNRWIKIILVTIVGILLYWFLVRDATDRLYENYVGSEYSSSGTVIRLAMNTLPASLFLLLRKRFRLPKAENSFWTMMSFASFGFIFLFFISPSSTAVDRLALYWITLQLFVFCRIPDVLGRQRGANTIWVFLILLYYAAVLATWLLFATNAYGWLPYQFYPWQWFWDLPGKVGPI